MKEVYKEDFSMMHAAYSKLRMHALILPASKKPLLSLLSRPAARTTSAFGEVFRRLAKCGQESLKQVSDEQNRVSDQIEAILEENPYRRQLNYSKIVIKIVQMSIDRKASGFLRIHLKSLQLRLSESQKREKLVALVVRGLGKLSLRAALFGLITHSRNLGFRERYAQEQTEYQTSVRLGKDFEFQKSKLDKLNQLVNRVKSRGLFARIASGAVATRFRALVEFAVGQKRSEDKRKLKLWRFSQITRKQTNTCLLAVVAQMRLFKNQRAGIDRMAAQRRHKILKSAIHLFRKAAHKRGWLIRRFVCNFSYNLHASLRASLHLLHRISAKHNQQSLLERIGLVGETLSESSEILSMLTQRNLTIDQTWADKGLREKRSLLLYVFSRIDLGYQGKVRKSLMRLAEFAANVRKAAPLLDNTKRKFALACTAGFSTIYRWSVMNLEKELVASIRQFKADAVTLGEETAAMGNAAVQLIEERRRVEEMRNREQKGRLIVQKTRYKLGKDNRMRIQYGLILEYWNKWRAKKKRHSLLKGILGSGRDFWLKKAHKALGKWYRKTKELSGYRDGLKLLCALAEKSRKTHEGEGWRNLVDRGFFIEESQLLNRIAAMDRRIDGLSESQTKHKLLQLEGIIGGIIESKKSKNFEHFFSTLATRSSVRPARMLIGRIILERESRRLLSDYWSQYRRNFKFKQAESVVAKRRLQRSLLSIFTILNYNRCQAIQTRRQTKLLDSLLRRVFASRCSQLFQALESTREKPPVYPLYSILHRMSVLTVYAGFAAVAHFGDRQSRPVPLIAAVSAVFKRQMKMSLVLMKAPAADDMFGCVLVSAKHEARLRMMKDKGVQSAGAAMSVARSLARLHEREGRSALEVSVMLGRAFSQSEVIGGHSRKGISEGLDHIRPVAELLPIKYSTVCSPPPTRLLFKYWSSWARKHKASRIIVQMYTHRFEQRLEPQTLFRKWAHLSGWEFNNPLRMGGYLSIQDEMTRLEKARTDLAIARNTLQAMKEKQDKETLVLDKVNFLKGRVVKSIMHALIRSREEKIAKIKLAQWYSKVFLIGFDERYSIPIVDNTLREVQELLYLQGQETTVLKHSVLNLRQASGKHSYVVQELHRSRQEALQAEELLRLRNHALQMLQSETDNLQKQLRRLQTESQRLVQGGIEAFDREQDADESNPMKFEEH